MTDSREDLLFYGKDLGALIRGYEVEIRREVDSWERNKILAASEPDLVVYLVEKYTLDPLRLLHDQVHIDDEGEAKIDVSGRRDFYFRDREVPHSVPGAFVTVAIPFEGDADLFGFQPSTFTLNPPRGRVTGSRVLVTFTDIKLDPKRTRQEMDTTVSSIDQYMNWIKTDCDGWNARVEAVAEQCVRNRKSRLLEQADMVSALGLPMKRRDYAVTTVSLPVVRRRRPVALPPTPREAFRPEPVLLDREYDFILTVIDRLAMAIERSPSTFVHMGEEQIRDLILVNLNGHYEGEATGETFNAQGKTDILIRADDRNVFIAECKIWEGPKVLLAAMDQVLRYLTWRDTKAALLIFSRNADFTSVLAAIGATVSQHPNFKRELKKCSETHFRYLFRQQGDPDRDLYLAVLAFNMPRSSKR